MRERLGQYENQFVLCRGWIGYWEELEDCDTRRIVVRQPTIKQADRNLLYEQQKLISTEHHLNLFIKHEDLIDYDTTFELNKPINFTGIIRGYRRSNGTFDYGVYANKQSTIAYKVRRLNNSIKDTLRTDNDPHEVIAYLESAFQQSLELIKTLDNSGDFLPTFTATYSHMREDLQENLNQIPYAIEVIQSVVAAENKRRAKNKNRNAINHINCLKDKRNPKKTDSLKKSMLEGFNLQ